MLRIDILTIFPDAITPYLRASILGRAQDRRLVRITAHDLRRWARDKHRTVDDKPYGGGAGMVMKVEPIFRAVTALKEKSKGKTRVILLSASGKLFTQRLAKRYASAFDQLIVICGRYEGVDARVSKYIADEEISIGPYVLTGGEIPALVIADAVTRLIPGVIRAESLEEESFSITLPKEGGSRSRILSRKAPRQTFGEYPHYTRPEVFFPNPRDRRIAWKVPNVLLSGDPKKVAAWRRAHLRALPFDNGARQAR
jgi:tRNA (guanine37-N1)-methyltransferase